MVSENIQKIAQEIIEERNNGHSLNADSIVSAEQLDNIWKTIMADIIEMSQYVDYLITGIPISGKETAETESIICFDVSFYHGENVVNVFAIDNDCGWQRKAYLNFSLNKEMLLGDARNPVKNIIGERLRDWKTTKETIEKNMEKQLSAELEKIREENERRRMIVQELEGTIE